MILQGLAQPLKEAKRLIDLVLNDNIESTDIINKKELQALKIEKTKLSIELLKIQKAIEE